MHHLNGSIRRLKGVIADKPEAPRGACVRVPHNLGSRHHHAKPAEGVIQLLQAQSRLKGWLAGKMGVREQAGQEEPAQLLQSKGACRLLIALCRKGQRATMVTRTQCSCPARAAHRRCICF